VNYQLLANLEHWLGQQIVGQQDLIHKLLIALLADGHLLVEGRTGPRQDACDQTNGRRH
jgi:MoxR-like ATPase